MHINVNLFMIPCNLYHTHTRTHAIMDKTPIRKITIVNSVNIAESNLILNCTSYISFIFLYFYPNTIMFIRIIVTPNIPCNYLHLYLNECLAASPLIWGLPFFISFIMISFIPIYRGGAAAGNFNKGLMVLTQMKATDVKLDSQTFSYIIGNYSCEDDIIKVVGC